MRVGIGFDVHPLTDGRPLVLGGVTVPHRKGLMGHSDADVLVHAIIDALLGASGQGDIGQIFPNTDSQYKDISSMILLEKVHAMIRNEGWTIQNIDTVIVAEAPKLSPFFHAMKSSIAAALKIPADSVHVKATTTEGLGFAGREEGIAAQAVALLSADSDPSAG